ncbi:response regulator [Chitinivorax sp. B]|uniref:sensor histidine kinase n=1 Tax=Chitinivorax sp. B TaxID=2502235 RepID=UPI0010F4A6B7|nr:response regulator [Chitinivorax sp. B]
MTHALEAYQLSGRQRTTILVVDDNPTNLSVICDCLEQAGIRTLVAQTGEAALERAALMLPQLILLDVMMPGMDGFETCRRLKQNETTSAIPVIFLTALAATDEKLNGFRAGGVDYLSKPIQQDELLARIHTHLRLSDLTQQLRRANEELEAFSYSVSHDLRAPLRAIDGFSDQLLDEYGQVLDEEGRFYLSRIRHGAQRMSNLIDDLLNLSRVGTATLNMVPVNLSELANNIVAELASANPQRTVSVTISPNLLARGDLRLLQIALQNLLNNAWKYTAKRTDAQVIFSQFEQAGHNGFYIQDNGVGFDMAYASKLFKAFQRLHADSEFEGTGVGLTIVRRIIERHGGEIWVEAAVDQGATFYFTLPDALHPPTLNGGTTLLGT